MSLSREVMTKTERRLLASTLGRLPERRRWRDTAACGWLCVGFSLLLAGALGYLGRMGGW